MPQNWFDLVQIFVSFIIWRKKKQTNKLVGFMNWECLWQQMDFLSGTLVWPQQLSVTPLTLSQECGPARHHLCCSHAWSICNFTNRRRLSFSLPFACERGKKDGCLCRCSFVATPGVQMQAAPPPCHSPSPAAVRTADKQAPPVFARCSIFILFIWYVVCSGSGSVSQRRLIFSD